MIVEAKNNCSKPLSATAKLDIIVLSLTDTPPQFEKLGYVFNVSENNEKFTHLGNLNVKATENLKSHKMELRILNDDHNAFTVDEKFNIKVRFKQSFRVPAFSG